MTSSSVTDFLISLSFLTAGGYALMLRLRATAAKPDIRDQHESIPRGSRPRGCSVVPGSGKGCHGHGSARLDPAAGTR